MALRRSARMLVAVLVLALVVYLAICAALFALQRSLLYFPSPARFGTVQSRATLQSGDALLQLTVRPHAGEKAVLYFGGNGEDVSGSVGPLLQAFPDRELVLLHYRGYGGSEGRPSEAAIALDAAALFDSVHAKHPDVVVVGRSLGTGVAARLAATRPATGLVLVTPYDSLLAIAQRHYPAFPVRWLLQDKYETWRWVPRVTAPVALVVAGRDEVIPMADSARLRDRFPAGQARWIVIDDASHNTVSDDPRYPAALASVLAPASFAVRPLAAAT